jgi:hypothetical protein
MCHTNATNCDHMHLYHYVLNFLTLWQGWRFYSNWSVFAYCMFVTQNVRKTLSLQNSPLALSNAKVGWICYSSTRILRILPVTQCILFSVMFPFSNQCHATNKFIYCNCLDLECQECHHLHRWPQITTQLPCQGSAGGFLHEKFLIVYAWMKYLLHLCNFYKGTLMLLGKLQHG